jgi:hypothetical protein
LELTGYPQLGGEGLHIAHVLWGGLLLYVAALLPLILSNRWVYIAGAILAGIGVGLFIDEVGKFITQSNDYFFPAAAPIIYAFFLLSVLLFLQVRRTPHQDPRTELYHALDSFSEVLDRDLDPEELANLKTRLLRISQQKDYPSLAKLADELLDFLESDEVHISPEVPSFWERIDEKINNLEAKYVNRNIMFALIVGGIAGLALATLAKVIELILDTYVYGNPNQMQVSIAASAGNGILNFVDWFFIRITLEAIIATSLIIAAVFLVNNRVRQGLSISYYALLALLSIVNLFLFYYDQFSTIIPAIIQFLILLGILYYRRRFLIFEQPKNLPVDN